MSLSSSVRSVKDLAHFSLKARQGNSQQVPVGGLQAVHSLVVVVMVGKPGQEET